MSRHEGYIRSIKPSPKARFYRSDLAQVPWHNLYISTQGQTSKDNQYRTCSSRNFHFKKYIYIRIDHVLCVWKGLVDIIFVVLDYEYFLATNVRLKLNCSFREWRLYVWNWIARPESGDCAFETELLVLRVETVRLKLNCSSLEWRLARLNLERSFLDGCDQGKRATPQETQVVSFLVESSSFQSIIRSYPLSHVWPPVPVYLLFASFSTIIRFAISHTSWL